MKHISITRLFLIVNTCTILFLLLVGLVALFIWNTQKELNLSHEKRYRSYLLANELRQSSDDLTRFARTYVVTGDPAYEQYYWQILDIRNGLLPRPQSYERIYWDLVASRGQKPRPDEMAIPLQKLMQAAGFTEAEFAKLSEAQKNSDDLVKSETIAMNAIKGRFDDGNGNFTVSSTPDSALARRIVHDNKYHADKARIMRPIDDFFQLLNTRTQQEVDSLKQKNNLTICILAALLVLAITAVSASYLIIRAKVVKPLIALQAHSQKIAVGDFSDKIPVQAQDEVGALIEAVNTVSDGLKIKANFVVEVGKGNLNTSFTPLSDKDGMGLSLLLMQDNLRQIAEEDRKRNWITEGLAAFAEILRSEHDIKLLCERFLSHLIKYLKANQGGLFILNDADSAKPVLELEACFAADRKKHVGMTMQLGSGLVGQAFLEKETVYLIDIPKDYTNILSGLGELSPSSLLIVPLKTNDQVVGIIEIASLQQLQPYEISFVEKLGESMASAIMSVKITETTKNLLQESQLQGEMLRAQEEEMRQNTEELQATQEEVQRRLQEYQWMLEQKEEEIKLLKEQLALPS